jgi:hypothetical protein
MLRFNCLLKSWAVFSPHHFLKAGNLGFGQTNTYTRSLLEHKPLPPRNECRCWSAPAAIWWEFVIREDRQLLVIDEPVEFEK